MKELSPSEYKEFLLKAIPLLKKCKKATGAEGTAYFFGDKFVVKQYTSIGRAHWDEFDALFTEFCKEMQDLGNVSAYPKVYAWVKIPNMAYYSGKEYNKFNYYILEERIKGRDLYYGFYHDSYDLCRDYMSFDEFDETIVHPLDNFSFFCKIMECYISDYIKINEFLESLNENEIEKFLLENLEVDKKYNYLCSDIHPTNIILENEKLRPIDPFVIFLNEKNFDIKEIKEKFIHKVLLLFWANEMVQNDSIKDYFGFNKNEIGNRFETLQSTNNKVCSEAMKKFFKVMNKCCDLPFVHNKNVMLDIEMLLEDIFCAQASYMDCVRNEINVSFEK